MEASSERFAYRCLPLNIANAYGWEMLLPTGFKAVERQARDAEACAIPIRAVQAHAARHFGHGVLTFHVCACSAPSPATI